MTFHKAIYFRYSPDAKPLHVRTMKAGSPKPEDLLCEGVFAPSFEPYFADLATCDHTKKLALYHLFTVFR